MSKIPSFIVVRIAQVFNVLQVRLSLSLANASNLKVLRHTHI